MPTDPDAVRRLLRLTVRSGARLCGIGKVCWLMASEGLLDGSVAAVHWHGRAAFAETHLTVEALNGLFAFDGRIMTCPGESAALDLALELLRHHFPDLVADVADRLLVSAARDATTPQPGAQGSRLRDVPVSVSVAAKIMAETIEAPHRMPVIAARCGLSSRQLERSFRQHLGLSPVRYYADLRLERAHELTTMTGLTMTEVAVATGFPSVATLSKRFSEKYGLTPTQLRRRAKPVCEVGRPRQETDESGSVRGVAVL
jgi:AraC family carnitine catabolism transcriptional activator